SPWLVSATEFSLQVIGRASLPEICLILKDNDNSVRLLRGACDIVSNMALDGFKESASLAVPALVHCLKHENAAVRRQAALALGSIGSYAKTAVTAITEALDDTSARVQMQSAFALYRIDSSKKESIQ